MKLGALMVLMDFKRSSYTMILSSERMVRKGQLAEVSMFVPKGSTVSAVVSSPYCRASRSHVDFTSRSVDTFFSGLFVPLSDRL